MAEKNKKPEIRFKGFSDEWVVRELGDLSDPLEYGLNAPAMSYDGINKYIRITDIDDESHEFNMNDLTSPNSDLNFAERYQLKSGDILFARTGASVGKTYIYNERDGLVYYAGFLIRSRIKNDINPYFIFQNTLTTKYKKFIKITSQRSGQPGVNASEYSHYVIIIPYDLLEQTKIGTFFQKLDNLITGHQQKHDKLTQIKKSMLEKMFPKEGADVPEIRFKGFSDKWVVKELGDVFSILNGYAFSSVHSVIDGISWVKIADVGIQEMKKDSLTYLPEHFIHKYSNYILKKGDYVVALTRPILRGELKIACIQAVEFYKLAHIAS